MAGAQPDSAPQRPGQMPASGWDIQAPYAPGEHQAIYVGGDDDPGGRDDVAGTVAGAKAAAEARFGELEGDTYAQGSQIGDLLALAQSPAGPGVGLADVDLPVAGLGYDPAG